MMPYRPATPCTHPGCPNLSHTRRCTEHTREEQRAYDATRGTGYERGYDNGWRKLRVGVLREQPVCACGEPATDIDHVISRRRGGGDERSNLVARCHSCHSRKTSVESGRWGPRVGRRNAEGFASRSSRLI